MWIDAIRWAGRLCYLLHRMDLIRAFSAILVLADPRKDFEDVIIVFQCFSGYSKSKTCFSFHISFSLWGFSACFEHICCHPRKQLGNFVSHSYLGPRICQQLVLAEADPNMSTGGSELTPLMLAASNGHEETTRFLLESWASLEFLFGEAFCFVSTYSSKVSHNRSKHIEDNMIWY